MDTNVLILNEANRFGQLDDFDQGLGLNQVIESVRDIHDIDQRRDQSYDNHINQTGLYKNLKNSSIDLDEINQSLPAGINEAEEELESARQLSKDGILDEETIELGLSNVGRTAKGDQRAYLNLALPGYNLKDISLLEDFVHLQKLDLSYNRLKDLSALNHIPFLVDLNVSHNGITKLLDFEPPKNLCELDCSYNNIENMEPLSKHPFLKKVILDYNKIKEIKGVSSCDRVTHLSLAHNSISKINNLEDLPLKYLNLANNKLKSIENIDKLFYLQNIDLSYNMVRTLNGLEGHSFLETINLESNEVIDLAEVQSIRELTSLRVLNLQGNPLRELPNYRLSLLFYLQQLVELDRRKVDVEEKVSAQNMFNPPMEVLAGRDHTMHAVYSFLQPNRIHDCTLPNIETPYPMLILVGPQGSGKKDLARKLVEEFPEFFGYGVSHTTRKARESEVHGIDYYFVSFDDFEDILKKGEFRETFQHEGEFYGLSIESVDSVARDGLACVLHMELEGVLSLKKTHFEPRYVLILPISKTAQERRMRATGHYTDEQIETAIARTELFAEYNREHPGFFDMIINSNEIVEAYKTLRQLVMDYLGVFPQSPSDFEDSESYLDRELTNDTLQSTAGIPPGSSLPPPTATSLSHAGENSSALPFSLGFAKPSQTIYSSGGSGILEQQSLHRRRSATRSAVAGNLPSAVDQVLRVPKTAPEPSVNMITKVTRNKLNSRSLSAPVYEDENPDTIPPDSPDSSVQSKASSSIHSAGQHSYSDEEKRSVDKESIELAIPLNNSSSDILVSGTHRSASDCTRQLAPRDQKKTETSLDEGVEGPSQSRSGSRIGSDRLPVLPPINSPCA